MGASVVVKRVVVFAGIFDERNMNMVHGCVIMGSLDIACAMKFDFERLWEIGSNFQNHSPPKFRWE